MIVAAEIERPALDEREVCRRLAPAIRAFARRRLRGPAAEDFTQDALVVLVGALRAGRIDDPSRVAGFALGVCRHLASDRAKMRDRRRELLERYGATELVDDVRWDETPSVARDHLEDCVSQLSARARTLVRATFYEGDADAVIAESLGLTVQNVRVVRHRTLAALRECLERPISWSVR